VSGLPTAVLYPPATSPSRTTFSLRSARLITILESRAAPRTRFERNIPFAAEATIATIGMPTQRTHHPPKLQLGSPPCMGFSLPGPQRRP
jgi:hypothetical protein